MLEATPTLQRRRRPPLFVRDEKEALHYFQRARNLFASRGLQAQVQYVDNSSLKRSARCARSS
jgi:hypothetical protein